MPNLHDRGADLSFTWQGREYGFSLYWDDPKSPPFNVASQGTAESTASFLKRDFPRIWHDWSGGSFHSLTPQNAGPLIYSSIGQFGTAPPVYAYTLRMRMRDPGVATTSGLAVEPTIYASSALTTELGLRGTPRVAFNYAGSVYFILSNGDVLKSLNGIGDPYLVANLTETNGVYAWSEVGDGSKTTTKTSYGTTFSPVKVVQFHGGFVVLQDDPTKPLLYFDGADENGEISDAHWYKSTAVGGIGDKAYWVHNARGFDFLVVRASHGALKYTNAHPLQAASYSAEFNIGEPSGSSATYGIRNMLSTGRVILVCKDDGVWTFDELGHSTNLTPHLANSTIGTANADVALVFEDGAYVNYFEGLYRVNLKSKEIQETGGWVTPGLNLPNRTPIQGPILSLAQDRDWLAAIMQWNGASYLGYGRPRKEDEPPVGPMIWHFSEWDRAGAATLLWRGTVASDAQSPRMWMGGDDGFGTAGSAFLAYQYLPRNQTALGDAEADGPMRFHPEGEIYLPADPIGDANALKYVLSSSLQASNLVMQSVSIDHQVRFSSSAAWQSLGIATDSDAYEGLPPEGYTGGYLVEQRLLCNGTTTTPPALYALRTRFAIITEAVGIRKYRLKMGLGVPIGANGLDRRPLHQQWAILMALTRAGKIRGHDRVLGDRLICKIEQEPKATPTEWSSMGPTALAVEIEVTVYAQGRSSVRFDDSMTAIYDSGSLIGRP